MKLQSLPRKLLVIKSIKTLSPLKRDQWNFKLIIIYKQMDLSFKPPSYWMLYHNWSWDSCIILTKKQTQVQQVEIRWLFCRVWSAKDCSAEADYWWQWSTLRGVSMAGPHSHCRVPVWRRTGQQVVCGHCSTLHSQVSSTVLW